MLRLPDHKHQTRIDHYIYPSRVPSELAIPLLQHRGRSAKPIVGVGDRVRTGQMIAAADGEHSVAVHASASGEVKAIGPRPHPIEGVAEAIFLRTDLNEIVDSSLVPRKNAEDLSREEILALFPECGLIHMESGEALHTTFQKALAAKVDTLVINAVEGDPFLTSSEVLVMNKSTEIFRGALLAKVLLGAERVFFAIGADKPNAREVLGSKMYGLGITNVELVPVSIDYPNDVEALLFARLLGVSIKEAARPFAAGALSLDVATCYAIADAIYGGKPLYERVMTVAGTAVAKPKNMLVRFGTSVEHLTGECGGMLREPRRIILGGAMRGTSQATAEAVVIKETVGVLVPVNEIEISEQIVPCVRCGLCAEYCPSDLLPEIITHAAETDQFDTARDFHVSACIECGNCTYVCPSHRPMGHLMRYAKAGALRS